MVLLPQLAVEAMALLRLVVEAMALLPQLAAKEMVLLQLVVEVMILLQKIHYLHLHWWDRRS
jgi:hypothetical protein